MSGNRPIHHPQRDVIVTYRKGVMQVEVAPPVVDPPELGPATAEQKAEADRIREERRKVGEQRALELRRKWENSRAPKRA